MYHLSALKTAVVLLGVFEGTCQAAKSVILYNTYANLDGVCVQDCVLAAKQVCAGNLSDAIEHISQAPSFVDIQSTVHSCAARFVNMNVTQNATIARRACEETFIDLINKTSTAEDTKCSGRLGGIAGNDALGNPTGEPVFYYGPVNTPNDGFQSSLADIPLKGVEPTNNTAFGFNVEQCYRTLRPIPNSDALSRRHLSAGVLGIIAAGGLVATTLCTVAAITTLVFGQLAVAAYASALCMALGEGTVAAVKAAAQMEQKYIEATPIEPRDLAVHGHSTRSSSRLHARITSAQDNSYCSSAVLDRINEMSPCLEQAFAHKCNTTIA